MKFNKDTVTKHLDCISSNDYKVMKMSDIESTIKYYSNEIIGHKFLLKSLEMKDKTLEGFHAIRLKDKISYCEDYISRLKTIERAFILQLISIEEKYINGVCTNE